MSDASKAKSLMSFRRNLYDRPHKNLTGRLARRPNFKPVGFLRLLLAVANRNFSGCIHQKQWLGLQPCIAGILDDVQWWNIFGWMPFQSCLQQTRFMIWHSVFLASPQRAIRFLSQVLAGKRYRRHELSHESLRLQIALGCYSMARMSRHRI
jgi:hypothetical protein